MSRLYSKLDEEIFAGMNVMVIGRMELALNIDYINYNAPNSPSERGEHFEQYVRENGLTVGELKIAAESAGYRLISARLEDRIENLKNQSGPKRPGM